MTANLLNSFGTDFQKKVLYNLLNDENFFTRIIDILDPNYFENEAMSWVVEKMYDYYETYKLQPTIDVLKINIKELANKDDNDSQAERNKIHAQSIYMFLKSSLDFADSKDLQHVKDKIVEFCRNREYVKALRNAVDLVKRNDFDAAFSVINKAHNAGSELDLGYMYEETLENRYMEDDRNPIPTPWPVLNSYMKGGLSFGELGVVLCPPKGGKSWLLISLAAHAMELGVNVVYYTMELYPTQISKRIDAYITDISLDNLSKDNMPLINKKMDEIPGKLIIKKYGAYKASTMTIRGHLDQCIHQGISPGLIIIDDPKLLKSTKTEKRFALDEIFTDIRNIADEYRVPAWVPSQANRTSESAKIVNGEHIAESYNVLMVCDFMFSLSRKNIYHIVASRLGDLGLSFEGALDTRCGKHVINSLISDVDDDDRGPAPKNSSAFDPAEVDKFFKEYNEISN